MIFFLSVSPESTEQGERKQRELLQRTRLTSYLYFITSVLIMLTNLPR